MTFPLLFNQLTVSMTTPHTKIFTLVVPVAGVLLTRLFLIRRPRWWEAAVYGGALGVLTLAYGFWIVAFVTAVLALLLGGVKAAIKPAAIFAAAFAAPNLAWIALCRIVAGSNYSHEAEAYRQFVWVFDAAGAGPGELWSTASSYALMTVREILAVPELWFAGVLIAALVVVAVIARAGLRPTDRAGFATLAGIGLTTAVTPLFLFGLGYYEPRFAYALLPPLLMLAGWMATRIGVKHRLLAAAVPAVCGLYIVYLATGWFGLA